MIRTLLTTTALVAVMSTGAFAQDSQSNQSSPLFSEDAPYDRTVTDRGYFEVSKGQILASSLIGKSVYSGTGEEAETIGDVNDIIVSANGTAEAVVIGVGGFLGIGERDVAIEFNRLNWVDRDGERWIVVEATKEELENAPEYDRSVLMPQTTAANEQAEGEENQTAMTDEPVEQDQTAMNEESEDSDMVKRDEMKQVDVSEISADELLGKRVYSETNEDIGEVADVILTDEGSIKTFVVDVGGFLGIDEKQVAISAENIDFRADEDNNVWVYTPFTAEELEQQAEYTEEGYQNDPESVTMTARPGADKP